eukprot:6463474-Amphidinium_carterae.1
MAMVPVSPPCAIASLSESATLGRGCAADSMTAAAAWLTMAEEPISVAAYGPMRALACSTVAM